MSTTFLTLFEFLMNYVQFLFLLANDKRGWYIVRCWWNSILEITICWISHSNFALNSVNYFVRKDVKIRWRMHHTASGPQPSSLLVVLYEVVRRDHSIPLSLGYLFRLEFQSQCQSRHIDEGSLSLSLTGKWCHRTAHKALKLDPQETRMLGHQMRLC